MKDSDSALGKKIRTVLNLENYEKSCKCKRVAAFLLDHNGFCLITQKQMLPELETVTFTFELHF